MKSTERILWIAAVAAVFGTLLGFAISRGVQAKDEVVSAQRIQIVDQAGRPRIILATDAEGTAKVTFVSPEGKLNSLIEQFRDGAMSLQFASAKQQEPSIVLSTDLLHGGPNLVMRGNGMAQTIVLGFPMEDVPVPGVPSKTWGLFFPSRHPFQDLAGIGAAEDLKSDERRGFVFPIK